MPVCYVPAPGHGNWKDKASVVTQNDAVARNAFVHVQYEYIKVQQIEKTHLRILGSDIYTPMSKYVEPRSPYSEM